MTSIGDDPVSKATSTLLVQAAVDLLPGWVQAMQGITRPPGFDALSVLLATFALFQTLAVLMGESPALTASKARAATIPAV